jgi:hypothetical protein
MINKNVFLEIGYINGPITTTTIKSSSVSRCLFWNLFVFPLGSTFLSVHVNNQDGDSDVTTVTVTFIGSSLFISTYDVNSKDTNFFRNL